jgi:hypothetical protein
VALDPNNLETVLDSLHNPQSSSTPVGVCFHCVRVFLTRPAHTRTSNLQAQAQKTQRLAELRKTVPLSATLIRWPFLKEEGALP